MKVLIEKIEATLRTKYPLETAAFTPSLYWLPRGPHYSYVICTNEGIVLAYCDLATLWGHLSANNLELLEQAIAEAQKEHARREAILRSVLENELTRLTK